MPTISVIHATWTGTPSDPGVSTFCVRDETGVNTDAAVAAVRDFFASLSASIPDEITITVDPLVEQFDEATGTLTGEFLSTTTPLPVDGTFSAGYASGVGVRIDWRTSTIRQGRRLRGRTFLVPTGHESFTSAGAVDPGMISSVDAAALTFVDACQLAGTPLVVWGRPSDTLGSGLAGEVVLGRCAPKPAFLRGRRD